MVRIIEGSKCVSPSVVEKDIRSVFKDLRDYMGQKGAVLAKLSERTYLSTGGATHNIHYQAVSAEGYELKGLGTVDVELRDSHWSTSPDAYISAKVTISGSDKLKKESNVPVNIKNILWLKDFNVGNDDLHDRMEEEELPPLMRSCRVP